MIRANCRTTSWLMALGLFVTIASLIGCGGGGGGSTAAPSSGSTDGSTSGDPGTTSTGTVSGRVFDASGNPLAGATVSAVSKAARTLSSRQTPATTTTGSDGSWTLTVPAGTVEIRVTKSGLSVVTIETTVQAGQTANTDPVMLTSASPSGGNPPSISQAPSVSPTTVQVTGAIQVNVTVTDSDTPADQLLVMAILLNQEKTQALSGPVTLSPASSTTGSVKFSGSIAVTNANVSGADILVWVLVVATDPSGSGQGVTAVSSTPVAIQPASFATPPPPPF